MDTLRLGRLQKLGPIAVTRRRRLLVLERLCQTKTRVWSSTTRRGSLLSARNSRAQIWTGLGLAAPVIPPLLGRRPPEVDSRPSLRNTALLERRLLAHDRPSILMWIWSKHPVRRRSTLCVHLEDHFEHCTRPGRERWFAGSLVQKITSSLSVFMDFRLPRCCSVLGLALWLNCDNKQQKKIPTRDPCFSYPVIFNPDPPSDDDALRSRNALYEPSSFILAPPMDWESDASLHLQSPADCRGQRYDQPYSATL